MGEFAYASFDYLKDGVLKEIPRGGFGIFINSWSLCEFFNIEYTFDSSVLERVNKVRGSNYKSSGEAHVASTLDQQYPEFLVRYSTRYVAVGTLLPRLSTLDVWSWEGAFGTRHELDREINNARTQLLEEIRL